MQNRRQDNYDTTIDSKSLMSSLQILLHQLKDDNGKQVSFSELFGILPSQQRSLDGIFPLKKKDLEVNLREHNLLLK